MEKKTFLIGGVLSLVMVISGFVAVYLKQNLISLLLIAVGFAIFSIVLKHAKKESWFGKPHKSFKT